jgi:hypothetical protein
VNSLSIIFSRSGGNHRRRCAGKTCSDLFEHQWWIAVRRIVSLVMVFRGCAAAGAIEAFFHQNFFDSDK